MFNQSITAVVSSVFFPLLGRHHCSDPPANLPGNKPVTCASAGNLVPQHLLPYESELGAGVTTERLIVHVCDMEKRPSIPRDWVQLAQVLTTPPATQFGCTSWSENCCVMLGFPNVQGSALQEILLDCWDCDPEARLTARCVSNRLVSLQSCTSVSVKHLHCSRCVTTV